LAQVAIALLIVEYTCSLQSLNNEVQSLPWVLWSIFENCCGQITICCWLLVLLAREEFTKLNGELEFSLASLNTEDGWELKGSTSVPEMVLYIFVRITTDPSVKCFAHTTTVISSPSWFKNLISEAGLAISVIL